MDMDSELNAKILILPKGLEWHSEPYGEVKGISWTNKYGFAAINTLGEKTVYCDGMNEKGLSAANLYLKETSYPMPKSTDNILAVMDIISWILGNFETVGEAKNALEHTVVWGNLYKPWGIVCPLHIVIHDAKGKTLVIEWLEGRMKLYENQHVFSVLTNSPSYEEQIENAEASQGSDKDIKNSKERFAFLYQTLNKYQSDHSASENNLIPVSEIIGRVVFARAKDKEKDSKYLYTQFMVIRDHTNHKFYFRYCNELNFREVDLN